jgi:hypothetical protein
MNYPESYTKPKSAFVAEIFVSNVLKMGTNGGRRVTDKGVSKNRENDTESFTEGIGNGNGKGKSDSNNNDSGDNRGINRRRTGFIADLTRGLYRWLFESSIETRERDLILFQALVAFTFLFLTYATILTPPAFMQKYSLVLPSWIWGMLLVLGIGIQLWSRWMGSIHMRRNAVAFSLLIMSGICGPLLLKGPLAGVLVAGIVVLQAIVGAQLSHQCKLLRRKKRAQSITLEEFSKEFFQGK